MSDPVERDEIDLAFGTWCDKDGYDDDKSFRAGAEWMRERCAKVAEQAARVFGHCWDASTAHAIAAAIREGE